jgi:hypothetical protein
MVTAHPDIREHQTAFVPKVVPAPSRLVGQVHRLVPDFRPPAGQTIPSGRVLRTHRKCAPEHAGLVRQLCRSDAQVLPRWHQDDRGPRDAHRGIHVLAAPGRYSRIVVWGSRERWLDFVVPIAVALHRDVLTEHGVTADTFRDWALVKSGYAKYRTGRQCIVRPDTVASVMGVAERTVQRCNAAAREMGLEIVVMVGRMLNRPESFAARAMGSRQRGLSTEVALTIPQAIGRIVDSVTPTSGRTLKPKRHLASGFPHGASADSEGAASPPHLRKRRRRPAGWRLAQELASSVPWLIGEGPTRLAPCLSRFAAANRPWAAGDLVAVIREYSLRSGWGPVDPERIRTRPAAVLAAILRAIDPDLDHPGLLEDAFAPQDTVSGAPVPVEAPAPCGHPDCDGTGWIQATTTGLHGRYAPCPHCPPAIRHQPLHLDDPDVPGWDPEDPPF